MQFAKLLFFLDILFFFLWVFVFLFGRVVLEWAAVRRRVVRFELGGLLNYACFAFLWWKCRVDGIVMDSCWGGTIK